MFEKFYFVRSVPSIMILWVWWKAIIFGRLISAKTYGYGRKSMFVSP